MIDNPFGVGLGILRRQKQGLVVFSVPIFVNRLQQFTELLVLDFRFGAILLKRFVLEEYEDSSGRRLLENLNVFGVADRKAVRACWLWRIRTSDQQNENVGCASSLQAILYHRPVGDERTVEVDDAIARGRLGEPIDQFPTQIEKLLETGSQKDI